MQKANDLSEYQTLAPGTAFSQTQVEAGNKNQIDKQRDKNKKNRASKKSINPELTEVVFEGNVMVKQQRDAGQHNSDELFLSNQVSQDSNIAEPNANETHPSNKDLISKKQKKQ